MRKTPSFSSSILDSIIRSIDDGALDDNDFKQQQQPVQDHDHRMNFSSESNKTRLQQTQSLNEVEQEQMSRSLIRRAMRWPESRNSNSNSQNGYFSPKRSSPDSSSSGTPASSETDTLPSYRSLPISFFLSPKTDEPVFRDDTISSKLETNFIKWTKLRAMKIYGDLKKGKQSRISTFICSLFTSSSSSKKKSKIEESMQRQSPAVKQVTTCISSPSSCISKKQDCSGVDRPVRFLPENDNVHLDRKSIDERKSNSIPLSNYERQWFADKSYMKSYKKAMGITQDDDDEDDDLFELENAGSMGTGAYGSQELQVFETTKIY